MIKVVSGFFFFLCTSAFVPALAYIGPCGDFCTYDWRGPGGLCNSIRNKVKDAQCHDENFPVDITHYAADGKSVLGEGGAVLRYAQFDAFDQDVQKWFTYIFLQLWPDNYFIERDSGSGHVTGRVTQSGRVVADRYKNIRFYNMWGGTTSVVCITPWKRESGTRTVTRKVSAGTKGWHTQYLLECASRDYNLERVIGLELWKQSPRSLSSATYEIEHRSFEWSQAPGALSSDDVALVLSSGVYLLVEDSTRSAAGDSPQLAGIDTDYSDVEFPDDAWGVWYRNRYYAVESYWDLIKGSGLGIKRNGTDIPRTWDGTHADSHPMKFTNIWRYERNLEVRRQENGDGETVCEWMLQDLRYGPDDEDQEAGLQLSVTQMTEWNDYIKYGGNISHNKGKRYENDDRAGITLSIDVDIDLEMHNRFRNIDCDDLESIGG